MLQESPQRRRQLTALFVALAIGVLTYLFFPVFVVAFGAVLLAIQLSLLARPFKRRLKLQNWAALTIAGLLLLAFVGTAAYLFGSKLVFDSKPSLKAALRRG